MGGAKSLLLPMGVFVVGCLLAAGAPGVAASSRDYHQIGQPKRSILDTLKLTRPVSSSHSNQDGAAGNNNNNGAGDEPSNLGGCDSDDGAAGRRLERTRRRIAKEECLTDQLFNADYPNIEQVARRTTIRGGNKWLCLCSVRLLLIQMGRLKENAFPVQCCKFDMFRDMAICKNMSGPSRSTTTTKKPPSTTTTATTTTTTSTSTTTMRPPDGMAAGAGKSTSTTTKKPADGPTSAAASTSTSTRKPSGSTTTLRPKDEYLRPTFRPTGKARKSKSKAAATKKPAKKEEADDEEEE